MTDNREFIKEVIGQSENGVHLQDMFSDHFDYLNEPVSVSLGVHMEEKTLEDVVKMLRTGGIDALPYYDPQVKDNLNCFVVDGSGIRSPILEPKDAIAATADMINVLSSNGLRTGLAIPVSKESYITAVSQSYDNNVIDIQANNYAESHVDDFIAGQLSLAAEQTESLPFAAQKGNLWRGGTLGDKPYAITFHDRKRDVAYGTNDFATAVGYADGYDGKGLTFKEINGKSYGFLYQFAEAEQQRYYPMAFIENGTESEECRNRAENRPDYETLVIPARNPLKAIYVVVSDAPGKRGPKESTIDINKYGIVKIADEKGFISADWQRFARLHTPHNICEQNDYMLQRMNRQIADFSPVPYTRLESSDYKAVEPGIYGLAFSRCIKELKDDAQFKYELSDAEFRSFQFPKEFDAISFKGSFRADNCPVPQSVSRLDLSKCTGVVGISNCDLSNIEEIVLPERCTCFYLENVRLPKRQHLDFKAIESQNITFRNCDFSDHANLSIPLSANIKDTKLSEIQKRLREMREKIELRTTDTRNKKGLSNSKDSGPEKIPELGGLQSTGRVPYKPQKVSKEQLQGLRYVHNSNMER